MSRRYLLVCRGPTCTSQGSGDVREHLRRALAAARAADPTAGEIVVLPYTCFDRCGRGPNAVLYPDGVWFEGLEPGDADDVVAHLCGHASAEHLVATVDQRHAEACYELFDELIPELEAEEVQRRERKPRRWWPF